MSGAMVCKRGQREHEKGEVFNGGRMESGQRQAQGVTGRFFPGGACAAAVEAEGLQGRRPPLHKPRGAWQGSRRFRGNRICALEYLAEETGAGNS